MNEAQCLAAIADGETAYDLLTAAMPGIERRFRRVDRAIIDFLALIKREFPDAQYYTASGGFNLMLGRSHGDHEVSQQQLLALGGRAAIGDGDF